MKKQTTIDIFPVKDEDLTPEEFIELVEKNPSLIERSSIIHPRLGGRGFGRIHVEYSRPRYKSLSPFKPVAR